MDKVITSGRPLLKSVYSVLHWGAMPGFHTEERLSQSFIVKIDLSGNRVDIEEE